MFVGTFRWIWRLSCSQIFLKKDSFLRLAKSGQNTSTRIYLFLQAYRFPLHRLFSASFLLCSVALPTSNTIVRWSEVVGACLGPRSISRLSRKKLQLKRLFIIYLFKIFLTHLSFAKANAQGGLQLLEGRGNTGHKIKQ